MTREPRLGRVVSDSRAVLAQLDARIPDAEAPRVAAWAADDAAVVAPTRPAASVLLLRDGEPRKQRFEVFVQHRHRAMAFAAGRVTFPGGRQESFDTDLRACAVRELAEETGVVLDEGALLDWAHWITPECDPLRYDTRFYLATLPVGQHARNTTTEAVRSQWVDPAAALAEVDAGHWSLMPPTRSLLLELVDAGSLGEVLARAADRRVGAVLAVPRHDPVRGWVWDHPEVWT